MSERVVFEAHVDRMSLQNLPTGRGESVRFWNAVCRCEECEKAYVRVRVTVEVIEDSAALAKRENGEG